MKSTNESLSGMVGSLGNWRGLCPRLYPTFRRIVQRKAPDRASRLALFDRSLEVNITAIIGRCWARPDGGRALRSSCRRARQRPIMTLMFTCGLEAKGWHAKGLRGRGFQPAFGLLLDSLRGVW